MHRGRDAEPVAVAVEREDVGVRQEPGGHRRGADVIADGPADHLAAEGSLGVVGSAHPSDSTRDRLRGKGIAPVLSARLEGSPRATRLMGARVWDEASVASGPHRRAPEATPASK